jgi:hypothetical protein
MDFLEPDGDPVEPDSISAPKAWQLVQLLQRGHPFSRLVECRRDDAHDIAVLDLDIEVPQLKVHDIRPLERVSVAFDREDRYIPEVLALRSDFPVVPHLNLRHRERPRSLCLFEEPYRDLKARWSGRMLVERVREWLRLTARGELHGDDQPLEPLLIDTAGTIIVPHDLVGVPGKLQPVSLVAWTDHRGRWMVVAEKVEPGTSSSSGRDAPKVVAASFLGAPRQHGSIRHSPKTLRDLHDLLAEGGDDMLGLIRGQLLEWKESPGALDAQLLFLIAIPKTRVAGGDIEATDMWAFLTAHNVRSIGQEVGRWQVKGGDVALLLPIDAEKRGEAVGLSLLNVTRTLSRATAAWISGLDAASDLRVTAIGAGALGSQVLMNIARSGWGRWTLIDDDTLLPHNLVRHACDGRHVGGPKALVVAAAANGIVDDAPAFTPLAADVLSPGEQREAVDRALREADVIVDMSASVAVARFLARDVTAAGRRISLFLNPTGTDLVLLAEDRTRTVPLDTLEMQYYRAVLGEPALHEHLDAPSGRIRYGRSCRDVTRRIPQEMVSLHAAIASRALRAAIEAGTAAGRVWRIEDPALSVRALELEIAPAPESRCEHWTVSVDDIVRARLRHLRRERLPSETGGVLLGALDLERRIIYVADAVRSPADSVEYPTAYIRGCRGLEDQVREAEKRTAHQLQYIGEWHSHPAGHACRPSEDDRTLLTWLTHHMGAAGLPGLVLIVGDDTTIASYVGSLDDKGGAVIHQMAPRA